MKFLLTGRNGQVGGELERALAPLGDTVAFGRSELDLARPDDIASAVRAARADVIVNAAAYTAVDKAESEPDAAFAVNAKAPGIFAEEAKRSGALLVHYSTDYVFDGSKSEPYLENDEPHPLNVYGASKLAGDEAIRASGARHFILRTSWVYGARGGNFLLTMLRLAREREQLRIVDDQIGTPTWSRTIAEATAQIIAEDGARARPSGIYNLCSTGETSWFGFAEAIFERSPARLVPRRPRLEPIASHEYPTAARRPKNSRLSLDRVRSTFGLSMPDWRDALERCLAEMAPAR